MIKIKRKILKVFFCFLFFISFITNGIFYLFSYYFTCFTYLTKFVSILLFTRLFPQKNSSVSHKTVSFHVINYDSLFFIIHSCWILLSYIYIIINSYSNISHTETLFCVCVYEKDMSETYTDKFRIKLY